MGHCSAECFRGSGQARLHLRKSKVLVESVSPSCSQLTLPVFLLHSLLLRFIFSPLVKEDDCWQPRLQSQPCTKTQAKRFQQTSPCKTLTGWAWAMHASWTYHCSRVAWVRVYARRVGGSTAPFCGTSWTWCMTMMIPPKEGLCEHKQYPTITGIHLICVLMSDTDRAHIVLINSFDAKMLGLPGSIWRCFHALGLLASCHKMLRIQKHVGLLNGFSDSKPPRWGFMSPLQALSSGLSWKHHDLL